MTLDLVRPVDNPADLGLAVLAQIVEQMPDGVTLADAQRRRVYANPSVAALLGRSQQDLLGTDHLDQLRAQAAEEAAARFDEVLVEGGTQVVTHTVVTAGGDRREVLLALHRAFIGDRPHVVCLSRDVTGSRAAARAGAALAHSVADLVGTTPTNDILMNVARYAVENTRGSASGLLTVDEHDRVDFGGGHGSPAFARPLETQLEWDQIHATSARRIVAAMSLGAIVPGQPAGRPVILPNARTAWQDDPDTRPFVDSIDDEHLHGVLLVPLSWDGRVIGVLALHLPPGLPAPDETEVAFCTALAAHASVAVINSRLAHRIERRASARERERLAGELHDSVGQSLFAMTLHSRAAQLAMRSTPIPSDAPLRVSVEQLAGLAQDALAEMRTLILQLRPEGLTEQGLIGALTTRADVMSRREDLRVEVESPGRPLMLTSEVESHLYRIVTEALHNVVKHARAEHAWVSLRVDGDVLVVHVADDGRGIDPDATTAGLGLTTMATRARAIGAEFTVTADRGTTVSIRVPFSPGNMPGDTGG